MNPSEQQGRKRYLRPDEAHRHARNAQRAGADVEKARELHRNLSGMTGFDSEATWRFLRSYGIQRPLSPRRRSLDTEKVVEHVLDYGYDSAMRKYQVSRKYLYNLLYRNGRTVGHNQGGYGMNQLRLLLKVRVETIQTWINMGALEATRVQYGGKQSYVVTDDQLRRFFKSHKEKARVIAHRFPAKRVEFLEEFLYDPSHSDLGLLRTRESKKEGEAFRRGEYLSPS
jgi:hypothetical protein